MTTTKELWNEATIKGSQNCINELKRYSAEYDDEAVNALNAIEENFKNSKKIGDTTGLLNTSLHLSLLKNYLLGYKSSMNELNSRLENNYSNAS